MYSIEGLIIRVAPCRFFLLSAICKSQQMICSSPYLTLYLIVCPISYPTIDLVVLSFKLVILLQLLPNPVFYSQVLGRVKAVKCSTSLHPFKIHSITRLSHRKSNYWAINSAHSNLFPLRWHSLPILFLVSLSFPVHTSVSRLSVYSGKETGNWTENHQRECRPSNSRITTSLSYHNYMRFPARAHSC